MDDQQHATTQGIAALIGADALAPLRHDAAASRLKSILDSRPPTAVPDFKTPISHDVYLTTREKLAQAATLAAMSGDERLEGIVRQWERLQRGYASQVIGNVRDGIGDQRQLLAAANEELKDGQTTLAAYDVIAKRRAGDLDEGEFEQLRKLRGQVAKLKETEKTRDELARAVEGVSKVEVTLTTLVELGFGSIHYAVPSVREAQERLGDNTYDGPKFEPFFVSNAARTEDHFMRNGTAQPQSRERRQRTCIDLDSLPPFLDDLARVYDHIVGLPVGARFKPGQLKRTLQLGTVGPKAIGAYLERSQAQCGVELIDGGPGREFKRKVTGAAPDRAAFIEHLIAGQLQPADTQAVNQFYFEKALTLLRERSDAYDGFSSAAVAEIAENHGLRVSRMFVAKNLGGENSGTKLSRDARPGKPAEYIFSEVVPTQTQVEYARAAVDNFGVDRFTPHELVERVTQLQGGYRMHERVATKALQAHLDAWGLRVASSRPLQYQKADRTVGTKTPRERGGAGVVGRVM